MRIRKNRTSSRFTPEFCEAHGIPYRKTDISIRRLDAPAAEFRSPQMELTDSTRTARPRLAIALEPTNETDEGVRTIQNYPDSVQTESPPIRSRDFMLAPRGDARPTGAQINLHTSCQTRESTWSESDACRTADSSERTATQHSNGKSLTYLTDKVRSDASSRPIHRRRKPEKKKAPPPLHVESAAEIPRNSQVAEVTSTKSVLWGSGESSSSMKKRRTQPDAKAVLDTGTAKTKSDDDVRAREPPAAARDVVVSSGTSKGQVRLQVREQRPQVKESAEKSPAASLFPAGWSYRGLAQIAEQDKPPQGKQCSRTDGRSWRCPLKVQEGSTLCEHHLSKFRLKKISKANKRKRNLDWKRKKQLVNEFEHQEQEQQQQPPEEDEEDVEEQQEQQEQEHIGQDEDEQQSPLEPPTPDSVPYQNKMVETTGTPTIGEHDVPMRNRRKHKTVKLSVL